MVFYFWDDFDGDVDGNKLCVGNLLLIGCPQLSQLYCNRERKEHVGLSMVDEDGSLKTPISKEGP